jgi:hypothetical protein
VLGPDDIQIVRDLQETIFKKHGVQISDEEAIYYLQHDSPQIRFNPNVKTPKLTTDIVRTFGPGAEGMEGASTNLGEVAVLADAHNVEATTVHEIAHNA